MTPLFLYLYECFTISVRSEKKLIGFWVLEFFVWFEKIKWENGIWPEVHRSNFEQSDRCCPSNKRTNSRRKWNLNVSF